MRNALRRIGARVRSMVDVVSALSLRSIYWCTDAVRTACMFVCRPIWWLVRFVLFLALLLPALAVLACFALVVMVRERTGRVDGR